MLATLSQIAGTSVISEQGENPIAIVKDLIIDPSNGGIIGASLLMSKKIIAWTDMRSWNPTGIKIIDESALIERDELVRLRQFNKNETSILAKPVFKEDGKFLGMVHDFVVNTNAGQLAKLYVARKFLLFTLEKRIIDYREIVEIKEDKITVKNDLREKKESIKDFLTLRRGVDIEPAI